MMKAIQTREKRAPNLQHWAAMILSVLLVTLISGFTNEMPPRWDSLNYIDIATNGISNNQKLIAPFAYRPGMPLFVGWISRTFSISIDEGFRYSSRFFAVLMLFFVFVLAMHITQNFLASISVLLLASVMGTHVKMPLFFYSMVDVSGFFFIVVAFWAFLRRNLVLCILISGIGLFFKEFMAIPLFLILFELGREYLRTRSRKILFMWVIASIVTMTAILAPRLLIHVHGTEQEIDPLNDPSSLSRIVAIPLKKARDLNIVFALVSYWLPTIMLLTRERARRLWQALSSYRPAILLYISMNFILVMYGGTNVMIFVSYMLPIQVWVLASLLKERVHWLEIVLVLLALMIYFKIFQAIPLPGNDFSGYIDFYSGWGSRLNMSTLTRFLLAAGFIALAAALRRMLGSRNVPDIR